METEKYLTEEWRDIRGFAGLYQVSNFGRVKNAKTGKFLVPHVTTGGYVQINLKKDGKRTFPLLHRLVAEAFISNPHNYPEINHIDECKTNNIVSNLEWCDRAYNANFGTLKERLAKSKVLQYDKNGKFICSYVSIGEAGRQTHLNSRHIGEACNGKRKTVGGFVWKFE